MLRELLADGPALFGVAVLVLLVLVAVFAPALAPYEPAAQSLRRPAAAAGLAGRRAPGTTCSAPTTWGATCCAG